MAKSKKSSGSKLTIVNDSNQGRQILLKSGSTVRIRKHGEEHIGKNDVSEQLQEMLDNYNTYGLRVIESAELQTEPEPIVSDDEDKGGD